ncbi:unnamed protein product [Bursaphelenchus okinawaensis]|uniref:RCC1 domain-containing protein n=1 Tax=Bursaphelenchus okinawaensis TaxID=465554 RepID=A0A811JT70_9BILA|nr:unnamed protein product [Bursaphelenchus okinawaensis]CAG9081372.1 unnamed protein product [Bursaphelenchus okinawaensis]
MLHETLFGAIEVNDEDYLYYYIVDKCSLTTHQLKLDVNTTKHCFWYNLQYVYIFNVTFGNIFRFDLRKKHIDCFYLSSNMQLPCQSSCSNLLKEVEGHEYRYNILEPEYHQIMSILKSTNEFPAMLSTLYYGYAISVVGEGTDIYKVDQDGLKQKKFKKKVVQVSCGNGHIIMLCSDNSVYCSGMGSRGELGQEQIVPHSDEPLLVPIPFEDDNEKIIKVRAGGWHNVVLTDAGNVYTWGLNDQDQCRHGSQVTIQKMPCFVELQKRVHDIGADQKSTFITYV